MDIGDGGEVDCDQNPMEREVKLQEDSELMSRDTSYFVITLETLCTVSAHSTMEISFYLAMLVLRYRTEILHKDKQLLPRLSRAKRRKSSKV